MSYKGDSSFKTYIGAVCSLSVRTFMLIFTVYGFISLATYDGSQITQFRKLDNRNDGVEINMQEAYGEFMFGFYALGTNAFVAPDPTICTLQLQSVSFEISSGKPEIIVHKDIEVQPVSRDSLPQLYESGSVISKLNTDGLFAIKDKRDAVFVNTFEN